VQRRVLVIGLDGLDPRLADRFESQGALPNFARFRERGARFELDHGRDRNSGLAWEHFSSGRAPRDGGRWSAVTFNPKKYTALQEGTSALPFMADLPVRTVVFDVPYCDISRAPRVRGVTSWGAHDPGVAAISRPAGIHRELDRLFGPYPAAEWIYGFCWPSADKARAAGDALEAAVHVRTKASRWLLAEHLPDWDLAVVVVSESHSAAEPLWHGIDSGHPLHTIESAANAANSLLKVYRAIDSLIGNLRETFPDAIMLLVAMHGMGPNNSDVPAMVLLPELLYRAAFGVPYMQTFPWPGFLPDGTPLLTEDANWESVMWKAIPPPPVPPPSLPSRLIRRLTGHSTKRPMPGAIDWIPAERYSRFWPEMPAFALPAFYDGRIRFNVAGRESRGVVSSDQYPIACRRTIELLKECHNLLTGENLVSKIHWPKQDPHALNSSEADLYVEWESSPLGLLSPQCGVIGPVPYRRTGGHTGPLGFLYADGEGIAPGDRGRASSFDVVPTIIGLLGEAPAPHISGKSLAQELRAVPAQTEAPV